MRERVRRRRVGEVVGGHVDRLHRRHRAGRRRGDPLLQLPHLGRERGLVADGARHASEQRRDLGARLHEAEDVVDEEQHVLALVAEVLGHRQPGQADAQSRARRLVHLPVDERDLVDHARLGHLEPEVVALACPLADAGEDGHAAVLQRDVVDELLDEDGLADSGAAEESDLAALHERRDQVDDLDPRLEGLDLRGEVAESRRIAVDRPALDAVRNRPGLVDRISDHVPEASERRAADGDGDRAARVHAGGAAGQAVGRVHRDRADAVVAEVLLHLRDERARLVAVRDLDLERGVDLRELVGEDGVDDDALDLDDPTRVRAVSTVLGHGSPDAKGLGGGSPRAGSGVYRRASRSSARSSHDPPQQRDACAAPCERL